MFEQVSGKDAHPGKQGNARFVPNDETLEIVMTLASEGRSLKIIALHLGISFHTLATWLGMVPLRAHLADIRVREAWEAGKAVREDYLKSKLNGIIDNDNHRQQAASIMFMLKCQHGWNERQYIEVEDKTPQKAPTKLITNDISPSDETTE